MLIFAFGQVRVVQKPFGINHFVIFWSFVLLLLLALAASGVIELAIADGLMTMCLVSPIRWGKGLRASRSFCWNDSPA